MRSHAKLVLMPLDRKELDICRDVLNAATSKELYRLTKRASEIAVRAAKGLDKECEKAVAGCWKTAEQKHRRDLEGNWMLAYRVLENTIRESKKKGVVVAGVPPIGVPSRVASSVPAGPQELFLWLAFRGIANRQFGRFIKCEYCGKWGVRKRARKAMRYGHEKCQEAAHLEMVKRSQNEAPEFSALGQSGRDAIRNKQIADREAVIGKLPAMLRHEREVIDWRARRESRN